MDWKASPKLPCGRSVDPKETIRRLETLIGGRYPYLLHEEQVSESLYWSALFIDDLAFRAMGKGVTPEQSRAGALAEAAEWLAGLDSERLPGFMEAHQDDLEPGTYLPIEDLLAHVATATPPVIRRIKELPDARLWADGWSLEQERMIKVPIAYAGLIGGPNGRAAGNTREEAVEHAVLEIFERRAQITVLRQQCVMPTLDPESIDDEGLQDHLAFIRGKGIEVTLKDLSFGGILPCVGAYFEDPAIPEAFQFRRFFKVGAAFDHREALRRTFTEFVQGRMHDEFIRPTREEQERLLAHDFRGLRVTASPCDNFLSAFMFGFVPGGDAGFLKDGPVVAFNRGMVSGDSLDDVRAAMQVCRQLGRDMIVVDFTDPDMGFPVVQVLVPGYSDVLPFHPASSPGLFRRLTRSEVLALYAQGAGTVAVPAGSEAPA